MVVKRYSMELENFQQMMHDLTGANFNIYPFGKEGFKISYKPNIKDVKFIGTFSPVLGLCIYEDKIPEEKRPKLNDILKRYGLDGI